MQDIFFDGFSNLVSIMVTAPIIYLGVILFIRVSGKRSTSQMNNFDWIVTVAMGSLVGSSLVLEDVTLAEALLATGMLMVLQFLFTFGAARSGWIERLIKSRPRILYTDGYCTEAMSRERITKSEIRAAIRETGTASLADIQWVVLESDATFSVIRKSESSQNSDVMTELRSTS